MKKLCFLLILALLLSLGASAFAEGGVEIIVMDGIPVVMESFGFEMSDSAAFGAAAGGAGFALPAELVEIGDGAFEGIPAERVEITANVTAIGARAFADCEKLTELVIPATVEHIDDTALAGSENVTVYGETGSAAQTFADDNKIPFVATNEPQTQPTYEAAKAPVVMPYVAFN